MPAHLHPRRHFAVNVTTPSRSTEGRPRPVLDARTWSSGLPAAIDREINHSSNRYLFAARVASTLFLIPIFENIFETWNFTVGTVTPVASAMARLLKP